ncbi:hypothetical protein EDB85DRAFT_1987597 [Lactarius pseudohatsudake]|nr:hypothetical protein EDB85DRAFT_1987597 [Lactarius pseudohatsudake]
MEKFARALLLHAVRLAGSQFARSFTRRLGLSLLQRKPEEWHRLHATPSVCICVWRCHFLRPRPRPSVSALRRDDKRRRGNSAWWEGAQEA